MSTYPVPTYDDANFRLQFPQFANTTDFPELQLQGWWDMGTNYINVLNGYPWSLNPKQLQLATDLMCAHLGNSFVLINSGQPTVVVQGSAEGTVNVTLTPPPARTAFNWWLSTTPYGQQLRALLRVVANVGLYVGGSLDRSGFRGAGGYFG